MNRSRRNLLLASVLALLGATLLSGGVFAQEPIFEKVDTGNGTFTIEPVNVPYEALVGMSEPTPKEQRQMANLPAWAPALMARVMDAPDMPTVVDNSETIYFRPIFSQAGSSCAQASGIGYNFTYEINVERGLDSSLEENQYPTHYTWNYLNGGYGFGSSYFSGWYIVKDNGVPNVPTWGGMDGDDSRWMTGYDNYLLGMNNRIATISTLTNINTPEGLEKLKEWIYDHGVGAEVGGLASFSAYIGGTQFVELTEGTPEAGKDLLTQWGISGSHAMTFVGYNDEVRYDFNGDGQYTNDIDINDDGEVDMSDWEIGALKMANSWGTDYGNDGFVYVSYKSLADPGSGGGTAVWGNAAYVITTETSHPVDVVLKVEMSHDDRNDLRIFASVEQEGRVFYKYFSNSLSYRAGDHPMQGEGVTDPIEMGLDVSELLEKIDPLECAHFGLHVNENDTDGMDSNGTIHAFSLMDYTAGVAETAYAASDIPIANNTETALYIGRNCGAGDGELRIEYMTYNTADQTDTGSVNIKIHNSGLTALSLSDIKAEYYYTYEGDDQAETTRIYTASHVPSWGYIGASVHADIQAMGDDRIMAISFDEAAGTLAPGEHVVVQVAFNKADWSDYDQSNDCSFGAITEYQDWTTIAGYIGGELVWGTTP